MNKLHFGIIGNIQSGKSTLINCILKKKVATIGDGTATTHVAVKYVYGKNERIEFRNEDDSVLSIDINDGAKLDTLENIKKMTVYLDIPVLEFVDITDLPGFGYNKHDDAIAEATIREIDYAIMVFPNDKAIGGEESEAFQNVKCLQKYNISYYTILNCTDTANNKWYPSHPYNAEISSENIHQLDFKLPMVFPRCGQMMPIINLMWYWCAIFPFGELYKKYEPVFDGYGIKIKTIESNYLIRSSNFSKIEEIFSMDNLMYLELKNEIKGLKKELCPIGTIQIFAFDSIPHGWVQCDGRSLLIEIYPELFNAIGTVFGGDGVYDFSIPDLRGNFVRGWDKDGSIDYERKFGSLQVDTIQIHSHKTSYCKKFETENSGIHSHNLYADSHYAVTSVGGLGNTADNREFIATKMSGETKKKEENNRNGIYSDGRYGAYIGNDGKHKHLIKMPTIKIEEPINMDNNEIRVSEETRPRNIALMFCIRAK